MAPFYQLALCNFESRPSDAIACSLKKLRNSLIYALCNIRSSDAIAFSIKLHDSLIYALCNILTGILLFDNVAGISKIAIENVQSYK